MSYGRVVVIGAVKAGVTVEDHVYVTWWERNQTMNEPVIKLLLQ
jgi:hypothetical protein